MRKLYALSLAVILTCSMVIVAQQVMTPPVAKKELKITKIHGTELRDNYFWLRDREEKKNPEIIEYLNAENAYTEAVMKPHKKFADDLYDEIIGRIKQTDLSVPYRLGAFWYFVKTEEGKQYPTYLRSKTRDGKDAATLLDLNELAEGHKYFAISNFRVSDNGDWLAYGVDTTGYRRYKLNIKNLKTGEILSNTVDGVTSVNWSNDGKYLFLTTENPVSKRSDKFWRHEISAGKNELLYEEKDNLFNIYAGRSRDRKVIFLSAGAKTMDEYRYLPADQPLAELKVILPREEGHEYGVDHYGNDFYIRTNKSAPDYRVVKAPVSDPSEKNWENFIKYDPAVRIESIDFFKDFAVVSELENGLEYLRVLDLKTNLSKRVKTSESVYTMGMAGGNVEFDTPTIMYSYSSMITPNSTFEYDVKSGKQTLLKQQEVLGAYNKSEYETKRVWATARDGEKVPVSLLMKKGTKLDGNAPLLLYAYGSYGLSMTPGFSTARLSLVDRGMIYAIAHIRGGAEMGEKWRQEGRMFKKLNTFYDFIDCAKWLIDNKYTTSERLVIQGGSAGGLLMGGVVNMSPETFKAAIVQVPFVDVINTMMDDTLPLTTEEWIEWGNPHDKEAFDYMIRYSPYDNIRAQDYPNMLVESSLNDSQVPYWEGAKFVAKVRELKTDNNFVLLKTNMGAGHGGSSGRYDRFKEVAFDYAYALTQVGIVK